MIEVFNRNRLVKIFSKNKIIEILSKNRVVDIFSQTRNVAIKSSVKKIIVKTGVQGLPGASGRDDFKHITGTRLILASETYTIFSNDLDLALTVAELPPCFEKAKYTFLGTSAFGIKISTDGVSDNQIMIGPNICAENGFIKCSDQGSAIVLFGISDKIYQATSQPVGTWFSDEN